MIEEIEEIKSPPIMITTTSQALFKDEDLEKDLTENIIKQLELDLENNQLNISDTTTTNLSRLYMQASLAEPYLNQLFSKLNLKISNESPIEQYLKNKENSNLLYQHNDITSTYQSDENLYSQANISEYKQCKYDNLNKWFLNKEIEYLDTLTYLNTIESLIQYSLFYPREQKALAKIAELVKSASQELKEKYFKIQLILNNFKIIAKISGLDEIEDFAYGMEINVSEIFDGFKSTSIDDEEKKGKERVREVRRQKEEKGVENVTE